MERIVVWLVGWFVSDDAVTMHQYDPPHYHYSLVIITFGIIVAVVIIIIMTTYSHSFIFLSDGRIQRQCIP